MSNNRRPRVSLYKEQARSHQSCFLFFLEWVAVKKYSQFTLIMHFKSLNPPNYLENTRDSGTNPSAKFHRYVLGFYMSVLKWAECHVTLANEGALFSFSFFLSFFFFPFPLASREPPSELMGVTSKKRLLHTVLHTVGRNVTRDFWLREKSEGFFFFAGAQGCF